MIDMASAHILAPRTRQGAGSSPCDDGAKLWPSGGARTRAGPMTERPAISITNLTKRYAPHKGEIPGRRTGVLISNGTGDATAYSLFYLQDRGPAMIGPQTTPMPQTAVARPCWWRGKVLRIIACESGVIGAPINPWMTR